MQQSFSHQKLNAIGLMSGTSLDGLDICLSEFNYCNGDWKYDILNAQTVVYPQDLSQRLYNSMSLGARELALLDADYGQWIGKQVKLFLDRHHINADIIGSHGHTVFHEPHRGFTTQIGSGAHIAAISGIPCVCNFRMGDVARGGQGAPLVPIGDELLFGDFQFCLNLGGFA
ncbi:MAG TPA: anhydro-N-acetylmuramic acid kinase, partial [Tenuifilaceae bacterium]|nr:anhydro-N-acetylmuramic acid kinase [Tenuifilaceae bacterium]